MTQPAEPAPRPSWHPASYRDPFSRVLLEGGRVLRALDETGLADWRALRDSELFARRTASGDLVGTTELDQVPARLAEQGWAALLEHERIPVVSYPYEWSFGMLRDAALLHLDLMDDALPEGLAIKDATPFNIQFRGPRPVFIDVGSFRERREGEPWLGYRQFCSQFLNPLLISALQEVPLQPLLRGSLEGIPPRDARNLLSPRNRRRRGVLAHVTLHARADRSARRPSGDVDAELQSAGFDVRLILRNVASLRKLISRLRPPPPTSHWTEYGTADGYTAEDRAAKERFVAEAAEAIRPKVALDLGCNDGRYSRIVAAHADYVVATDGDADTVELLAERLKAEDRTNILPLVLELAAPSPGLGWRNAERSPFDERVRPGLVLALALTHHLQLSQNVPTDDVLDWLASFGCPVVVEHVGAEDPMVRALLARRRERDRRVPSDDAFDAGLRRRFRVERTVDMSSGTRRLYLALPH